MTDLARLVHRLENGVTVAVLEGEVDLSNAKGIENDLLGALRVHRADVIFDLSSASYVDSAGIRMLFSLASKLRTRGRNLYLVIPDEALIHRALVLARVHEAAPIYGTIADARTALSRAS